MAVHYVVEYGDERGNQRQTTYTTDAARVDENTGGFQKRYYSATDAESADESINDALLTIRLLGLDPDTDPYLTVYPEEGSIAHNASQYVDNGVPWDYVWSIGDGDNCFSVHGYDTEHGNWSVSLTMVREA